MLVQTVQLKDLTGDKVKKKPQMDGIEQTRDRCISDMQGCDMHTCMEQIVHATTQVRFIRRMKAKNESNDTFL